MLRSSVPRIGDCGQAGQLRPEGGWRDGARPLRQSQVIAPKVKQFRFPPGIWAVGVHIPGAGNLSGVKLPGSGHLEYDVGEGGIEWRRSLHVLEGRLGLGFPIVLAGDTQGQERERLLLSTMPN